MHMGVAERHGPGFVNQLDAVSANTASQAVPARAHIAPGRPTILIASTTWWAFPARIAMESASRGLAVDVICGRGHPLQKAGAVRRHFRYGALKPLAALASAIKHSGAALVIPCDDRALLHLQQLRAQTQDENLRRIVDLSLGDPAAYAVIGDRAALAECAIELGIAAPETVRLQAGENLAGALGRLGLPAVLKVDGTWGGFGVAVVRTRQQAEAGFARLARPISLGQAIKRLLVDRDPFHVLPWLQGQKPRISLQRYVPGRPANSVSACLDGEILGTICAEAIAVQRPLGASSVVRIIDHPQMAMAAEKLARHLKLSGVFGLDFLIDEAQRRGAAGGDECAGDAAMPSRFRRRPRPDRRDYGNRGPTAGERAILHHRSRCNRLFPASLAHRAPRYAAAYRLS